MIADVFTLTGDLAECADDQSTADGRPRTREFCAARLLRMVGADVETVDVDVVNALARACVSVMQVRVSRAVRDVVGSQSLQRVIFSGSGAAIATGLVADELADVEHTQIDDLAARPVAASACAVALTQLVPLHTHPQNS